VPDEPLKSSSFFQKKFKIPADQVIILHFGHIVGIRFSLELANVAQEFHTDWRLVLHGRDEGPIVEQIKKIDADNRVIISRDLVPEEKIHELISSAHIGLVLYPSFDLNHRLTAFSSEKIALKLRAGLPIIAFNYPGYEIFEEKRCGVLIHSLDEIPFAIEKILASYTEFSHNARQCFLEHYEHSRNFENVIQFINRM